MIIKSAIKKFFAFFNITIARAVSDVTPDAFVEHDVTLLFDVGANSGQFALTMRASGYKNRIVSFEPLEEAHQELLVNASLDEGWQVAPKVALGSKSQSAVINVSKNSWSSSILDMLPACSDVEKNSIFVSKQKVEIRTLDELYQEYLLKTDEIIGIKIDTQGFEKEVLLGSIDVLSKVKVVMIELSVVPLYADSELYEYFFDFFKRNGFTLWNIVPGFSNRTTGQLLQFDAYFVRL